MFGGSFVVFWYSVLHEVDSQDTASFLLRDKRKNWVEEVWRKQKCAFFPKLRYVEQTNNQIRSIVNYCSQLLQSTTIALEKKKQKQTSFVSVLGIEADREKSPLKDQSLSTSRSVFTPFKRFLCNHENYEWNPPCIKCIDGVIQLSCLQLMPMEINEKLSVFRSLKNSFT